MCQIIMAFYFLGIAMSETVPAPPHRSSVTPIFAGRGLLRSLAGRLDIGLLLVHGDRAIYANPAALRLTGAETPTLAFQAVRSAFDAVLPCSSGEWRRIRIGERLLECAGHGLPRGRFCCLLRDVTARARLESIAQAVNTTNNLGFVVAGLRHELGNPLNALKMTLSVLHKNLDTFPAALQREYVERSLGEVARIELLLKSLKSFNLYETCDMVEHDLGELLRRFALLVTSDLKGRGIRLEVEPVPPGCRVRVDQRALQQALLNLLANAADALEGRPDPLIVLSVRRAQGIVRLSVRDNGCGIAPEQMEGLFRPFCTTKPHGNGLGLVITRDLLARMSGEIEVESQQGEGTTFTILLPEAGEKEGGCPRS